MPLTMSALTTNAKKPWLILRCALPPFVYLKAQRHRRAECRKFHRRLYFENKHCVQVPRGLLEQPSPPLMLQLLSPDNQHAADLPNEEL